MFALVSLVSSSATSSDTCPAGWNQQVGACLWPKQHSYKTVDVSSAPDQSAACCGACAAEADECVSWLVYSAQHSGYDAGTCILNNQTVTGTPPALPICTIGFRPSASWPPTPAPAPAPAGAKNVLFFAVDDLRPDINSFGGVPGTHAPPLHTPNIDALAAMSLVLTKNYVQQAVCSPTRQSILTSRRPDRTRVYDLYSNFRTVAANYTTIPEFFMHHGYKTHGMGKIFHPGHASGDAPGMGGGDDQCCSWSNLNATPYFHAPNDKYWDSPEASTGNSGKASFSVDPATEAKFPLPDNQTADHAIAALERLEIASKTKGDHKPWFLAVGFHKPHLPFVASKEFFDMYPVDDISLPPNAQPPQGMPRVAWSGNGELMAYTDQGLPNFNYSRLPGSLLPDADTLALRRAYRAAVSQTDAMVGRVMEALKATSFMDNTVISFWGDHGWQLGEHGEWCKHTNFEFATRAPMMIRVPGLTDSGITTKWFTEHVDLLPTLSEAAMGITVPLCPKGDASFDVALCTEGTSLVPMMKDPSKPVKLASFSQYPRGYQKPSEGYYGEDLFEKIIVNGTLQEKFTTSACIKDITQPGNGKGCTMGYTLVTVRATDGCEYRYTEWADFNTAGFAFKVNWLRNVGVELYNHTADPGENFNLNSTMDGDAATMEVSAELSAMLRAGPDSARV